MNFVRAKSKKVLWTLSSREKSFGLEPKPFPPRNFALSVKMAKTYGPFFCVYFQMKCVCILSDGAGSVLVLV